MLESVEVGVGAWKARVEVARTCPFTWPSASECVLGMAGGVAICIFALGSGLFGAHAGLVLEAGAWVGVQRWWEGQP